MLLLLACAAMAGAAARGMASSAAAAPPLLAPANVWCVGRNYSEHVKELGNAPQTDGEPMIFLKAGSSVLQSGG